jgi:hypothetical protein
MLDPVSEKYALRLAIRLRLLATRKQRLTMDRVYQTFYDGMEGVWHFDDEMSDTVIHLSGTGYNPTKIYGLLRGAYKARRNGNGHEL